MTSPRQIAMHVRKRLPRPVRWLLRVAKLVAQPGHSSAAVSPELIGDCRFFASRVDMLGALPAGGEIAEVGTDRGDFARHILATARPARLHLFDLEFASLAADIAGDPRVSLYLGASAKTIGALTDQSMDWIYIDGDHSYAGVAADIRAAAAKVRPGGYLVFNDFAHADPFLGRYGVHRAVMEFVASARWPIVMFAYEPNGLYDVALRRPQAR
ncbi:MAG: hypothetical protein BroJett030_28410 [Alphaproteobacteria bacterium]|nr:MAG: hypothetical protein BroJett030_28410 [Alphaproteobacteria bacterium]